MLMIERTDDFNAWLVALKDRVAQKQILARLDRLADGHWGDLNRLMTSLSCGFT